MSSNQDNGNAAELREALKRIVAASIVAKNANAPEWILQRMADIFAMATTALAAPPRNCDRFNTWDEADQYLFETKCRHCGDHDYTCEDCKCEWLFTREDGGKDGSK